jgi:hypothetical protein
MDHLPKPIGRDKHDAIHMYTTRERFPPGCFFAIPRDSDYGINDYELLLDKGIPEKMSTDPELANKFLQDWLFFGLLSQVLNREIRTSDFRESDMRQTVTTKSLIGLISSWNEGRSAETGRQRTNRETTHYIRASMALDHARAFVEKHLSIRFQDDDLTDRPGAVFPAGINGIHQKLDQKLTLSIALLGESLQITRPDLAMFLQQRNPFWTDRSFEQKSWGFSVYCWAEMKRRRLCPFEIRRLQSVLRSNRAAYYRAFYEPKERSSDIYHESENCSASQCVQPYESQSPMKHISCDSNNDCTRVPTQNETKLVQWIERGSIPLVKLTKSGPEWVEHNPNVSTLYVAISHSWREEIFDTGKDARNRHDRQMRHCQLKRLQESANAVIQRQKNEASTPSKPPSAEPVLLYVDALCFPRDPAIKTKAIQQLRTVYQEAAAVIVWDRDLIQKEKPPPLEANILIQTGDWCRRLWTLQEAVLARKLYIEFEKGHVSVTDIEQAKECAQDLHEPDHFLHDAGWHFIDTIRKLKQSDDPSRIQNAWEACQSRQIRPSADEPLVIAALLGVDVSEVESSSSPTSTHDENDLRARRMVRLLDILDRTKGLGVPAGIIFTCGQRLKHFDGTVVKGFEWAPLTWLTRQSHVFPRMQSLNNAGDLMRRGIQVEMPGIHLHPPSAPFSHTRCWIPVHPCLHIWYTIEVALENEAWTDLWLDAGREKDISIILSAAAPKDRWEIGAVVIQNGELHNSKIRWVQWVCRVWVRLETRPHTIMQMRDRFREKPDEMCFGERVAEDQKWCIDGVYDLPEARDIGGSSTPAQDCPSTAQSLAESRSHNGSQVSRSLFSGESTRRTDVSPSFRQSTSPKHASNRGTGRTRGSLNSRQALSTPNMSEPGSQHADHSPNSRRSSSDPHTAEASPRRAGHTASRGGRRAGGGGHRPCADRRGGGT